MRAVHFDGTSVRLRRDAEEPVPSPGEVGLRVVAAGICETDLQIARGYMKFRGVLGHEFVGVTDDGRRVTAEINNSCQVCPTCLARRPNHCPHRSVLGILGHDGAMADRVCVPARNLHEIPDSIDDREAVFVEPLAAAFRVPEQVSIGPSTRVAVVGDGKLGLLCAWVARSLGAEVVLIGKHAEKLALGGEGVRPVPLDLAASLAGSQEVVIEASASPSGLETALGLVRACGTVVLKTTVAAHHDLGLASVVIDEVRVIGSRCGPFPKAIAALASRSIDVRPLIGAEFPLDRAEEAFQIAGTRGSRKVLLWT